MLKKIQKPITFTSKYVQKVTIGNKILTMDGNITTIDPIVIQKLRALKFKEIKPEEVKSEDVPEEKEPAKKTSNKKKSTKKSQED